MLTSEENPRMSENILTPYDLESSTWKRLAEFLLNRKIAALLENAKPQPEERTIRLRARIEELDALLHLDARLHNRLMKRMGGQGGDD
jgi:hypothetical protein